MWSITATLAVLSISSSSCQTVYNESSQSNTTTERMQADGVSPYGGTSHVSLQFGGEQYGLASIIAPQFAVTSCSVIKKKPIYEAMIVAAMSEFNPTGHVYQVKDFECHPEFELSQPALAAGVTRNIHDVGVIRIEGTFEDPSNSTPILPMVEGYHPPPEGAMTRVYSFNSDGRSDEAVLEVLRLDDCKYEYRNQGGMNYGEICAVGDKMKKVPVNLCDSDEGASMILGGYLVAYASWVSGCHWNKTVPSVFTEIARNRYWIDSAMEKMFEKERREEMSFFEGIFAPQSIDEIPCKIGLYSPVDITVRNCNALCLDRKFRKGECPARACLCHNRTEELYYERAKRITEIQI